MNRYFVTWQIKKGCVAGHSIRCGMIVDAKTPKAAVKAARAVFEQSSDAHMLSVGAMRVHNVAEEEFLIKDIQAAVRRWDVDDVILYPHL